jgi:hypothetical protein
LLIELHLIPPVAESAIPDIGDVLRGQVLLARPDHRLLLEMLVGELCELAGRSGPR